MNVPGRALWKWGDEFHINNGSLWREPWGFYICLGFPVPFTDGRWCAFRFFVGPRFRPRLKFYAWVSSPLSVVYDVVARPLAKRPS